MAKGNEISISFVAQEKLSNLSSDEKLKFVLREVKKGHILVLENGLSSEEQAKLIEMTMKDIDDGFVGIEMESYMEEKRSFWQKIFGKKNRMTIIGPADKLKTIYRDREIIKTVVKAG